MEWEQLKCEYWQNDSLTLHSLAQKYGLNENALKKRSAKEGWAKEKKRRRSALKQALAEQGEQLAQTAQDTSLLQKEKINRIAQNLLSSIEQGTQLFEKPAHIATLTGALKELTAILRDVNEMPNQVQRTKYELAKKKLEIEQNKTQKNSRKGEEGGVVMLPEVTAADAAE